MNEENKKIKGTTPEDRKELWADLVRGVADKLPVQNKEQFIKLCLDLFDKEYKDEYENPFFVNEYYGMRNWQDIINYAASGKDGIFIKCIRTRHNGGFKTEWRKVNKRDYLKQMESEARSLETRIEHYNENKETAQKRWENLQLPGFDIQRLPANT